MLFPFLDEKTQIFTEDKNKDLHGLYNQSEIIKILRELKPSNMPNLPIKEVKTFTHIPFPHSFSSHFSFIFLKLKFLIGIT